MTAQDSPPHCDTAIPLRPRPLLLFTCREAPDFSSESTTLALLNSAAQCSGVRPKGHEGKSLKNAEKIEHS